MLKRYSFRAILGVTLLAVWLILGIGAVQAGGHDDARRAVRSGQALPLSQILGQVRGQFPGKLMDARYNKRRGIYRLRIMSPQGRVRTVTVDARSGRILGQR